jgi:Domain of unknown function (DUF4268)
VFAYVALNTHFKCFKLNLMELGILKSMSPRAKWTREAREFTPWLAANIQSLNSAIGLELEIENTEVACGPYSADILAKDTGTGRYVIIENQLEKTNHDHLGKAITYASVLDATSVVWIASVFSEEHIKALDWLNDHTSEDISFYGVQLELWQIDDSKPALRFNVISKPNEAVRQAAKNKASDELSGSKQIQLAFWSKFSEKLASTRKVPSVQSPRPQYWFDVSLGRTNIHLSNTCNTDLNAVGVRVYIRNQIAESMLPYLESKKSELEASIGQPLTWNPNPDNRDKVITLLHPTDFNDPAKVTEAVDWLVSYTIRFRDAFWPVISKAPQ